MEAGTQTLGRVEEGVGSAFLMIVVATVLFLMTSIPFWMADIHWGRTQALAWLAGAWSVLAWVGWAGTENVETEIEVGDLPIGMDEAFLSGRAARLRVDSFFRGRAVQEENTPLPPESEFLAEIRRRRREEGNERDE